MNKVEIFQECHNILGEGALWSNSTNTLFWLDIPMPSKLHSYSFDTREYNTYAMPEMITAMAERSESNLLIASHYGLNNYNLAEKKFEPIIKIEPDKPENRCNDGAADFLGNFWVGTMQNNIVLKKKKKKIDLKIIKFLNKKEFAKFDRGYPDGSTVELGYLWNCRWGGSCVVRFDPKVMLIELLTYLYQM